MDPKNALPPRARKRLIVLAAVILLLLAVNLAVPARKVRPPLTARTLKDLAELATVEYEVTKIVSHKDIAWYGDRKILFETAAEVKAGIDLNELADQDVRVEGDAVTVTLPRPRILLFNMKPGSMREIFNESGILRSDFSNQEKDALLSLGEKDIRAKVAAMDVLDRAARNARILVESWLRRSGYSAVRVEFRAAGGAA
ncbi:MAG TPA: DUF4230 domain-containing protein [Candidatus Aminicenantes bacterium]|nr:DUF4230 domain-containing protein [Candidatus Aminicenantes bacterium]